MEPDLSERQPIYQLFPSLKSRDAERHHLPQQLTTFVGRRSEISALRKIAKGSRLVTLIGPGGIGKSRLAIQVAGASAERWPDGIWWVDLTPIDDPQHLIGTVGAALNLQGQPPAVVNSWLADKRALIVLDNCEHLVRACAEFSEAILEHCPGVCIVATSREALGASGEARWPVPPLKEADALNLFEQRGQLVHPDFKITASNREDVSQICRRLDELPLAIELAASRLGMLTEGEISIQLAEHSNLLSVRRSADPRHQTMATTIDWSYRLLTESEATLFRRLSVFRGGFTLEAARAICADQLIPDVFSTLGGLVEKSMVQVERIDDGASRYRLLELQADYAEDKFTASGESDEIQKRHYDYFADAIASKISGLSGPMATVVSGVPQATWQRLELRNLWAAAGWARRQREDLGLEFAGRVALCGSVDSKQARKWLAELLDQSPAQGPPRLLATSAACNLAYLQGDYEAALDLATKAVEIVRFAPDHDVLAMALWHFGNASDALGRSEAAESAYLEAMALVEGSSNTRILSALQNALGCHALEQGRHERARAILAQSVASAGGDDNLRSGALDSLANADLACGDPESAEQRWTEALSISRRLGARAIEVICVGGLSQIATASGDHARALRLAAAHSRACKELSTQDEPYARAQLARSQEKSRAALGPKRSDEAWNEGLAMDLQRAMDYALEDRLETGVDPGPLSRREADVALLVAAGMTNRAIGEKLFIAERTVEGHVERIRHKLGVRSRTEVATWAVEHGITAGNKGR